ncbi:MAG: hypothetical protein B7C24_06150 [Bacteroidetes bacterium 4572_77]|nr:MAG: hypothetical protein B7C24_06150 [Bacteroidetes bacterium 4572_77]
MKNKLIILTTLLLFLASCNYIPDSYTTSIQAERTKKDSLYKIIGESPLSAMQIDSFTSLDYFLVDKKYMVEAKLSKFTEKEIVQLKTSTDRLPNYLRYGLVTFSIDGINYQLTAFKSTDEKNPEYNNYLFLPFTDNNSTISTYGGGRYLDFEIPVSENFIIDFNKAYNPYCAYNHKWSCVIPPRENALPIAINAGEKKYITQH